ncbi:hypothetical protein PV327_009480 [Microctonus hyperodae]|uniref:Uncharacterized protein n=1 Tax=Microctonus hyperodae TaxID=165561 RepID=A0AA39FU86_MICHY|nr:hypothetical protein PV327_009480 [Microctonus hyperodae]
MLKMIPEVQNACQTTESTLTGRDVEDKTRCRPDEEAVTTITAWNQYQKFVELVESRGIEYNKKTTIEAMFRGNDLVYAKYR